MIARLVGAWKGYWFREAPVLDLAVARVIIVGTQLWLLVSHHDYPGSFPALSALPDEMYDPLPILHVLVAPVGWAYRPGFEVLQAIYWIAVVCGVTSLVGLFTNASLLLFAWGNVFLQAYQYSFTDFHHPEGPMMIGLVMLALSPAGRALSVDAWRARRSPGKAARGPTSPFARWPGLVIGWVLALAYFSAAFYKMRVAGLDWMNGHTLQYYILQDATRLELPLGVWVGQQLGIILALSWLTILWEGTFFLVLVFPALLWIYVPLGLGFHTGIYMTMNAPFFTFMALYSALIPWTRTYEWWREHRPELRGPLLASLLLLLTACGDGGTGPSGSRIIEGVDFDALFAQPTGQEIQAISDEWAARAHTASQVSILVDSTLTVGSLDIRVRIVSHDVQGVTHVGAVLNEAALGGPTPVLVYAHGGDEGARVDDALSLLDVTLQIEPAADGERVGVLGFSRGAGEASPPRRDVPPAAEAWELSIADVRPELIRRSAVLFADRLPALQLHHGELDTTVDVSQAESLIHAMQDLGRGEPDFEALLYPTGTHSLFTLAESVPRAIEFLTPLLPVPGS